MSTTLFNHKRSNNRGNRFSFAGIVNKESNTISIGVAKCSTKDQFSKEFGRHISEARAMKKPIVEIQIKDGNSPSYEFNNAVKNIAVHTIK